jgi:hypothetical protein
MSFVPANQNWWCNACLAATEGEAPAGLKGPTADQVADEKHKASHAKVAAAGERMTGLTAGDTFDIFDFAFILPILILIGGGMLIYSGSFIIGAILIGAVVVGGILFG